ncbi:MAG TPA: methyltransferase, partial [Chroococcales cyanobacterium]
MAKKEQSDKGARLAHSNEGSADSHRPVESVGVPSLDELVKGTVADFEALSRLVGCLQDDKTEAQACRVLHLLAEKIAGTAVDNLQVKSVDVPGTAAPLRLFLSPAVFTPELWGRTFAEGLMKSPEQFSSKSIVELGTGSGWISLLLLLRTEASEVVGLDINPVAVTLARLNVWLNGTTSDGSYINSQYGVPIVRALRIEESDLLAVPLNENRKFDFVIGCIPQVLHPDAEATAERRTTDSDLYDLSNYCFQQGILEDRFGLPLIARALEEAQLCLNPGGKVTIILGGRPGPQAIDAMFRRRGFEAKLIWSRRIPQADDTDLSSLVKLERHHGIQFHFFISRNSRQSISAETAMKILKADQEIFHDLLVYTAETRWQKPTFRFLSNLHAMGLDNLRKELDFSRMTEEQISFL